MESYRPPDVKALEFRDADGEVIPYGERWGMESPPDDAYSVTTHPERFAPLADVARGLIAYLERAYEVTVTADLALADQVNKPRDNAVAAVRVVPNSPEAATLTFEFSEFSGVSLEAGAHFSDRFPTCDCDACDESVEGQARRLEEVVFGIVAGVLTETMQPWKGRGVLPTLLSPRGFAFTLAVEGGASSNWSLPSPRDKERMRDIRTRIESRQGQPWAAWSPRED